MEPKSKGRERTMVLEKIDDRDQRNVTNQGGKRHKVVLAPNWPTLMKFHWTGKGREATSRQMAPEKARIWAKMAENRGETLNRIQKLNGFSDLKTGGRNRPGACHPDARTGHVVGREPEKTVAHCCQKSRNLTRRA